LALSGSDLLGDLELWEVATWRRLRTFRGHKAKVSSVCLSSDARYALSGSSDETLRLWEVGTGRCLRTFQGHTGAVNGVCLSADERYALSGSNDKTLRLWALDWELEPAVSEGKGSWFSRLFGKGVRWAKQE
jgi:WD40 repeat protein